MHTVRAQGNETRTKLCPLKVAYAVGLYIGGHTSPEAAEEAGLIKSSLANILRRLDVMRTRGEGARQTQIEQGKTSIIARRRILEREYTPKEAFFAQEELCEKWGICRSTLRRDLRAISYTLDASTARILSEWGGLRAYHEAQRKVAWLRRQKEEPMHKIADNIGVSKTTAYHLLEKWDERKEGSDDGVMDHVDDEQHIPRGGASGGITEHESTDVV